MILTLRSSPSLLDRSCPPFTPQKTTTTLTPPAASGIHPMSTARGSTVPNPSAIDPISRIPRHLLPCLLAWLFTSFATSYAAELKLPAVFCDHMVLQREKPLAIWGWANPEESVSVSFAGHVRTATASPTGEWSLQLDPLDASSEPRTLTVTGQADRKLEVKDVLVGEVWFGSGQSNMAMSVGEAAHFDEEKTQADQPHIRYFGESSGPAETPQRDGKGAWQICSPTTVRRFSATLYFFGREIHRELGVPIGLIASAVGATHIEFWIPADAQSADPETRGEYETSLKGWTHFDEEKIRADHPKRIAAWQLAVEQGKATLKDKPWPPETTIAHVRRKGPPAGLFNGKVYHLAPFPLRGILWYQGESNAGAPHLYHKHLSQLVTSWRALWKDELPFAWVQLPNFTAPGEGWPRIREAMLKTLALPRTGMAVTIDLGDPKDIHPKNKQDVGKRLSLWALGTVYKKSVSAVSGPLPIASTVQGETIVVSFNHADGGLRSMTGKRLAGFQIAAADRHWLDAEATIEGETVVIRNAEIRHPVAARYAWKDLPEISLTNAAGLPATPFRTDDWPTTKK